MHLILFSGRHCIPDVGAADDGEGDEVLHQAQRVLVPHEHLSNFYDI